MACQIIEISQPAQLLNMIGRSCYINSHPHSSENILRIWSQRPLQSAEHSLAIQNINDLLLVHFLAEVKL